MTTTMYPGIVDSRSSLIAPACCRERARAEHQKIPGECGRFDLSQIRAGIVPLDNAATTAPSGRFRPAGVATKHPRDERHPHEIRQGCRLHLGHEIRPIDLDRARA